jgi:hypothetical protein
MGSGNYNESIQGNYIQGNFINIGQDLSQVATLLWDLSANTPQESRVNLEDNPKTGDRNIHMGFGNYNESIQGNYIQGDYIEIQGCYTNFT